MSAAILQRQHWVFDMDGTLTIAVHDFEAIRKELGIDSGRPILEALTEMPRDEAAPLWQRLDEMELELAREARPVAGAHALLEALAARGCRLGIVTRNNLQCARETLSACGYDHFFAEQFVLDRDAGAPKPEPDALLQLMDAWNAIPHDTVMVGDYLFDLQAGRAAGAATIYVDASGAFEWASHADISVARLDELLPLPAVGPSSARYRAED